MKIECLKDKLLNMVSKAVRLTTSKNSSLPILGCLFLEGKDNQLKIQATNLDVGINLEIPVKTEKSGKTAVPADILNNLLLSLPGSKFVKLELEGVDLKIKADKSQASIKVKNPEDFPKIPQTKSDPFMVHTDDFVNSLKEVWYSSANNSTLKPELSSVFVHTEDKEMIFAATDSFRLAEKRIKIKSNKDFGSALIPFKNALEIARALEDGGSELSIYLDKNQISLSNGEVYLTSRLVSGNFPDYKQIIPKKFQTEITVLKQDFINALKVASVFSDKFNQINFKIAPSKKDFEIVTRNPEVGENICKVDAVFEGEAIDINFNLKYIFDCLQSFVGDSLTLSFNDLSRPMVIQGVSDRGFLYLVMPMNK